MRILIGYSMRSGSTLLQHVLDGHSQIEAYGDLSSVGALLRRATGLADRTHLCIKPMDLLYLQPGHGFYRHFDRFVWIARDPRDSYLSALESGYAYLLWPPGRRREGIDLGLLRRWQRVYHRHYFAQPERWHLLRYEDLVSAPAPTLARLLRYLGVAQEPLFPFPQFKRRHGGDYKLRQHRTISTGSRERHRGQLTARQEDVFEEVLGEDMAALGYWPGRVGGVKQASPPAWPADRRRA